LETDVRPFHIRKWKKVVRFKIVDQSLLFLEVWFRGIRAVVGSVNEEVLRKDVVCS